MSRPLKFRAWDGERMRDAFDLSSNPKYWWSQNEDYPLMQFTGLKDKNGVEIYEGDVVELHSWKPSIKETKRQVIRWIGSGLFMCRVDGSVLGHAELPPSRLEVIGNIHDHPDLLEATT